HADCEFLPLTRGQRFLRSGYRCTHAVSCLPAQRPACSASIFAAPFILRWQSPLSALYSSTTHDELKLSDCDAFARSHSGLLCPFAARQVMLRSIRRAWVVDVIRGVIGTCIRNRHMVTFSYHM